MVIFPRLPLAAEEALKDLATRRGLSWSEVGAELVAHGLGRRGELPPTLPVRYSSADTADLTVRIPVADNEQLRALARELDRHLSIVAGSLIEIGLRHGPELPGQIPVQYATPQEQPLTKAS